MCGRGKGERGSVLPLVAVGILVAGGAVLLLGRMGTAAVDRASARTAADAAALAGAAEGRAAACAGPGPTPIPPGSRCAGEGRARVRVARAPTPDAAAVHRPGLRPVSRSFACPGTLTCAGPVAAAGTAAFAHAPPRGSSAA